MQFSVHPAICTGMQGILGAVPRLEKAQRDKNTAPHSETTGKPQALFQPRPAWLCRADRLLENDLQFNGRLIAARLPIRPPTQDCIVRLPPINKKRARHLVHGLAQSNGRAECLHGSECAFACVLLAIGNALEPAGKDKAQADAAQPRGSPRYQKKWSARINGCANGLPDVAHGPRGPAVNHSRLDHI